MPSARPAVAMVIAAASLFGTAGTAQALGPDDTSPLGIAACRLLLGGAIMAAMLPALGHGMRDLAAMLRTPLVWLAALFSLLFQVCYFTAASLAGVALGTLIIMGSVPVFTGLLGALLGHRVTWAWTIATAVCAAGLVLLSLDGIHSGSPVGVLVAIVGALAGAAFTLLVKALSDRGTPTVPATITSYVIAGVALVPVLLAQPLHWVLTPSGALLALYLGVVAMAIPNILWVKALGALAPGPTSTLMLTEPAMATLLGLVVLGETLTVAGVLGLVLVLLGLLLQGVSTSRSPAMADEPIAPL